MDNEKEKITQDQSLAKNNIGFISNISSNSKQLYNNYILPFVYSKTSSLYNSNSPLIVLKDLINNNKEQLNLLLKSRRAEIYHSLTTEDYKDCYILGKHFNLDNNQEFEDFLLFYWSRLISTYKLNIPKFKGLINKDIEYTSDTGWGCTYRTGQSLMMQSLARSKLDPFEYDLTKLKDQDIKRKYLEIINLFVENEGQLCLKSMLMSLSETENNKIDAGQFIGPSTTATIIKKLMQNVNYNVYLNREGVIYRDKIPDKETLILINLRLGVDKINPIYHDFIKKCFECRFNVGMIGGSGTSSFYYVGYIGSNMVYFDPHIPKDTVTSITCDELEKCESFHYLGIPKTINLAKLDPNITLGFVISNSVQFDEFAQYFENCSNNKVVGFFAIHPSEKQLNEIRMEDVIDFDDETSENESK